MKLSKFFYFGIACFIPVIALLFWQPLGFKILKFIPIICITLVIFLFFVSLLTMKGRIGEWIPVKQRIVGYLDYMLAPAGYSSLVMCIGIFFLERSEIRRELNSVRLVEAKAVFDGTEKKLFVLVDDPWDDYPVFAKGDTVILERSFISGSDSIKKITSDMFISLSTSRSIDNISVRKKYYSENNADNIALCRESIHSAYRYTISKQGIVIHDPKDK